MYDKNSNISETVEGSQDKEFVVQGKFTFPSTSVPNLIRENTERRLSKPLSPFLLVALGKLQGIWR